MGVTTVSVAKTSVRFGLGLRQTQTLIFVMLVFSGQATVYVARERGHFWKSRPVNGLVVATCFDVVVSALAVGGVLMTPLALPYVLLVLAIAGVFMVLMDPLKVVVLGRLGLV
jgi:H+-transporting ATPase